MRGFSVLSLHDYRICRLEFLDCSGSEEACAHRLALLIYGKRFGSSQVIVVILAFLQLGMIWAWVYIDVLETFEAKEEE